MGSEDLLTWTSQSSNGGERGAQTERRRQGAGGMHRPVPMGSWGVCPLPKEMRRVPCVGMKQCQMRKDEGVEKGEELLYIPMAIVNFIQVW